MKTIQWREQSPHLHEAVIRAADGRKVYAGYVARTPPRAVWRGYVGATFEPVGLGSLEIMKAAVEQRVRDGGGVVPGAAARAGDRDSRDQGRGTA